VLVRDPVVVVQMITDYFVPEGAERPFEIPAVAVSVPHVKQAFIRDGPEQIYEFILAKQHIAK
jgi:hypothetical protein